MKIEKSTFNNKNELIKHNRKQVKTLLVLIISAVVAILSSNKYVQIYFVLLLLITLQKFLVSKIA